MRADGGRRWPAEWEPHRATWLAWPHNPTTWPGRIGAVEDAFCEIVRAIVPGEIVEIAVGSPERADRVDGLLRGAGVETRERVRYRGIETDDAWIRDHGGIFVFEADRIRAAERELAGESISTPRRVMVDFTFDAWGGKYPPWNRDADVARQMAEILRAEREVVDVVLEGGSIEGDGEGTILTTESCLLNPNRAGRRVRGDSGPAPGSGVPRERGAIEDLLAQTLGTRRVLWLGDGIEGDDTDGHVDDLTRFVAPGRVVTAVESDAEDANHSVLASNRAALEWMEDAAGRKLEVVELPMPPALLGPEGRLPASYANFYFANAALLVPVFGCDRDAEAVGILERVVTDRPVVPIPAKDLVLGLGAVHCLTMQEPYSTEPANLAGLRSR